jgi:acyl-CoA hydrolase
MQPMIVSEVGQAVDVVIERLGKVIAVGLPLGLGKPVEFINALYDRARTDPQIRLRILTALSLERPAPAHPLEKAFLEPFLDRVFGDAPELEYAADLRRGALPANVELREFFFRPGGFLDNAHAQRNYISSNYTHAARDTFANGCNLVAQMICKREVDGQTRYSLSCNPDTAPELVAMLRAAAARGERRAAVVGLVNQNLRYMANDAEVAPEYFDLVVDHPRYTRTLFSTPKQPVVTPEHLIGLNASALVADGGTLQIGIGTLGDAIVHALKLRHEQNGEYRDALQSAGILEHAGAAIRECGGTGRFEEGLYGATEMFVDGLLHLYRAGILKRRVYDYAPLQKLLNEHRVDPARITPAVLEELEREGVRVLRTKDFAMLQHHGLLRDDCSYELGCVVARDGERIAANLAIPESRLQLAKKCLGERLRNGIVLHGGFFLGPNDFYQALRDMPEDERRLICMTGVDRINQLDLNPLLYKAQRRDARFINTGIMATLDGAIVSDGLEDSRVVSGVGGQYNFVAMAHHLLSGRSILMIRAVRDWDDGRSSSNLLWRYGHCTIPRHLRDMVITEYGVAELRSRTDNEVMKALLNVADSRFQQGLLEQAQRAGKIEPGYRIPEAFRSNSPERLERILAPYRARGLFPAFPLGCELTEEELVLGKALKSLKARARQPQWRNLLDAWKVRQIPAGALPFLRRMKLESPAAWKDRIVQRLLVLELHRAGVFSLR